MTTKLKNFVNGQWIEGNETGAALYHAVTGEHIFNAHEKSCCEACFHAYEHSELHP